jgi:hypothetical protein
VSATKSNHLTLNREVIAIRSGNRIKNARKLTLWGKIGIFLLAKPGGAWRNHCDIKG